jgi:uncharacterized secreted repeat protein (TIGR03808 family)
MLEREFSRTRRALLQGIALGAGASLIPLRAFAQEAAETKNLQENLDQTTAKGRPFILPAKTLLTGPLTVPDGAHIVGRPGKSVLAFATAASGLIIRNAERVTLQSVILDGLGASLAADRGLITASDVRDLRLDDCTIRNMGGDGLRLERCGGRIERCAISGAQRAALFSLDATGLTIADNTVTDCADNGILVWRSAKGDDGSIIEGNRISGIGARSGGTGQYGNGINLFRAGGVIVAGNQIRQCRFSAIRNNGGSNIAITGNICAGFEESAIWHEFDFDGGTVNGNVVDGAMIGILVVNLGSHNGRLAAVTGNIIRNCRRKAHIGDGEIGGGIGIKAEGEISITGNVIDAADHAGIEIGWGEFLRGAVVANNAISGPNIGIAVSVADGAGEAVISANAISGARLAIAGTKWHEIATGDLLAGSAAYPRLMISGNLVR